MGRFTLLMPFLARGEGYDLCLKVLDFYKNQGHEQDVLIALSGTHVEKEKFKEALLENGLAIRIYDHPEESSDQLGVRVLYDKLYQAVSLVKTHYVAMISGDDFTFPDAVNSACDILEKTAEISACAGKGLLYNPDTRATLIYPQDARMNPDTKERLTDYIIRPTALFYSTFRTEDLKDIVEKTVDFISTNAGLIRSNISFSEHILSFLTILRGQLYIQDNLYFIRLQGNQQAGGKVPNLLGSYIIGDVDNFISQAACACGTEGSVISSAYKEYIYRRGQRAPFFVFKNPRFMVASPHRSFILVIQSWLRTFYITPKNWEPDDAHKAYIRSPSYQLVMDYLS